MTLARRPRGAYAHEGETLARKNRHDWSIFARDQLCGLDQPFDDPRPAHDKALAACRATITEVHRLSRGAVAQNVTTGRFLDVLASADVAGDVPPARRCGSS